MKRIRFVMGALLLLLVFTSCAEDTEGKCNCDSKEKPVEINRLEATASFDEGMGMYLLTHRVSGSIDVVCVYMVDNEKDIEKIHTLDSDKVVFSGTATKSIYLPNAQVAGTEYYCMSLSDISVVIP